MYSRSENVNLGFGIEFRENDRKAPVASMQIHDVSVNVLQPKCESGKRLTATVKEILPKHNAVKNQLVVVGIDWHLFDDIPRAPQT